MFGATRNRSNEGQAPRLVLLVMMGILRDLLLHLLGLEQMQARELATAIARVLQRNTALMKTQQNQEESSKFLQTNQIRDAET